MSISDSKGGDLLAQLRAKMSSGNSKDPHPQEQAGNRPITNANKRPHRGKPHLPAGAQRAQQVLQQKKQAAAKAARVQVIKPRNAEEKALYRKILNADALDGPGESAQDTNASHDFGEGAFRRLSAARDDLSGFVANHRSPSEVDASDADAVRRRVEAGAKAAADIVDEDNGYFLGYDFGTSTTKVVARNPYAAGGNTVAFAIDVPSGIASGGKPHLFPTAVYWNPEKDHFSLVPSDGYLLLDSFKSALIRDCGHRICNASGLKMSEAATAFLTLHIAYCLGAAREALPEFRISGLNTGIPVAVFEGRKSVETFRDIFDAATDLIRSAPTLSVKDLRAAMSGAASGPIRVNPFAELAGAVAGYCSAVRYYHGGHMIIDCGSATLDIVTFDLDQRTGRPIGIYSASVENLGADACVLYMRNGASLADCQQAVRYQEHFTYSRAARTKRNLFLMEERGYPYQVILIGGGVASDVHKPFFESAAAAFEKPFHVPDVDTDLSYDRRCEAPRLILADGLARDPIELHDIALPRPLPPAEWKDPPAPGPEQV